MSSYVRRGWRMTNNPRNDACGSISPLNDEGAFRKNCTGHGDSLLYCLNPDRTGERGRRIFIQCSRDILQRLTIAFYDEAVRIRQFVCPLYQLFRRVHRKETNGEEDYHGSQYS